jgi:hypothetical protein
VDPDQYAVPDIHVDAAAYLHLYPAPDQYGRTHEHAGTANKYSAPTHRHAGTANEYAGTADKYTRTPNGTAAPSADGYVGTRHGYLRTRVSCLRHTRTDRWTLIPKFRMQAPKRFVS